MSIHKKTCCRGGAHAPKRCYCSCTCNIEENNKEEPAVKKYVQTVTLKLQNGDMVQRSFRTHSEYPTVTEWNSFIEEIKQEDSHVNNNKWVTVNIFTLINE